MTIWETHVKISIWGTDLEKIYGVIPYGKNSSKIYGWGASPILTLATSGKRTRNQISLLSFLGKLSGNSLENLIQANSERGGEGGMTLRYMVEPSQIQNSKNFKLPFTVFN